jgi:SAM-dependent methyltransferase
MTPADTEPQVLIDARFGEAAGYWRDVYAHEGLQGLVYRERMKAALAWIDALRLAPGARVLEVGCGAGHTTVELARRGLTVTSSDSSEDMVSAASRQVAEAGLADAVTMDVADVHALPHPDDSFALVVALGVFPWLHSPELAVQELARVLAPDGHAVVTADNALRLNMLIEPAQNPLLVPLKLAWRAARRALGSPPDEMVPRLYTPSSVDRMLRTAGLEPERRTTVGYGPFTFRWRPVLGDRTGLRLHFWLQGLAGRGVPGLRRAGWHYVVSARRRSA